jgi:hypothetical protein
VVLEIMEAIPSMVVRVVVEHHNMQQVMVQEMLVLILQLKDTLEEVVLPLLIKAVVVVEEQVAQVRPVTVVMVGMVVLVQVHFHLGVVLQDMVKM